ncbi:MAG: hypothetical protein A4E35_00015 [Methanoregula sp. PtaU1.Bin051]|nr:MAG: hypothetical protein A4E35_00015 [Methanoregula sp. PtaU1.Bin051]
MEFTLCPGIRLGTGTFNVIVADERLLVAVLNASPELQRFMFLYICGSYSRILPAIDASSADFDVRRALTAGQLLTVIKEAYHTIVVVEHDPSVYEGGADMAGPVASALKEVSREALVILSACRQDFLLNRLMRPADRVFHFTGFPAPARATAGSPVYRDHTLYEVPQRVPEGI